MLQGKDTKLETHKETGGVELESAVREDAWRRSPYVPPPAENSVPKRSFGIRAVVASSVSSVTSMFSRSASKKNEQTQDTKLAAANTSSSETAVVKFDQKWKNRRLRAGEEGRDTSLESTDSSLTIPQV